MVKLPSHEFSFNEAQKAKFHGGLRWRMRRSARCSGTSDALSAGPSLHDWELNAGVIARCRDGLYSRAVRKFCWQRWTLIFLLMARLVVGELGHAMPVAAMTPLHAATSEVVGEPACAEHEAPKADHSEDSSGEHDCCKSGDCECPCLHVPCVALDAVVMNPVSIALLRIPQGVDTFPAARPSGLFRPPA